MTDEPNLVARYLQGEPIPEMDIRAACRRFSMRVAKNHREMRRLRGRKQRKTSL